MSGQGIDRDNAFWDFSLQVYAKPGVAEACLALQDARGQDVNLLLFCCWAASLGRHLTAEEAALLERLSADWREEAVRPLRRARRHLKPLEGDPAVAALRAKIKACELEAERLQQARLFAALPLEAGGAEQDPIPVARENLGTLAATRGEAPLDGETFLRAVFA